MHSDESAIVGVGIDQTSGCLYIRDIDSAKMHPDELYDRSIKMVQSLRARALAVEVTSLNEFVTQPFKNELSRRGIFSAEFIPLTARGGLQSGSKEKRVGALVPYYRQGLIFHNPNVCAPLEAQLLSYPRSKKWDIMDALAYVIELLDIGNRFFDPPDDVLEDELEDLEREAEPALQGWRSI
jgi:predicted phage terminase large subunit-like protein